MFVQDKVAIVTGGAVGIGFATARELLKNGVKPKINGNKMAQGGASLESQFVNFSKFGDPNSDGKKMTLSKNDVWMLQALVIDGKKVTIVDTGICFNKFKRHSINFSEFLMFLNDLAHCQGIDADEMKVKLMECGMPGATATTAGAAAPT